MKINVKPGFSIVSGNEYISQYEYMIKNFPYNYAFDKNGIDETGLKFMTINKYLNHLINTDQFDKLLTLSLKSGYNIIWSGKITKYLPYIVLKEILEFREDPLIYDSNLFPDEENQIRKLRQKSITPIFQYGYKNYKTNKYGLSLEDSIKTIMSVLKSDQITILYEDYY